MIVQLVALNVLAYGALACLSLIYVILSPFIIGLFYMRTGGVTGAVRYFNWLYLFLVIRLFRPIVHIELTGLENVPRGKSFIAAFNHRSFTDVFFSGLLPARSYLMMVRTWPLRLPFYGWFMRLARYLDIEKQGFENWFNAACQDIENQSCIVCFPEGHRMRAGKSAPFRSGAFRLSVKTGAPILPVCLDGTERVCPPGSILLRPARVRMDILPPLETPPEEDSGNRVRNLRLWTEEAIRDRLRFNRENEAL